ncbi:MAG: hypothetical protein A2Z96_02130 [Spirochaetes bacterium GWB1_48_6]|nr:MAG: hypothetical protein A2Z96_02130 [Spirochaetes bacterium GWB1_48_6]
MKNNFALIFAGLILSQVLGAQDIQVVAPVDPIFNTKTQYYEITSYVSQAQADETGLKMEALLNRYNSYFLQDLAKISPPLKVLWFKNKLDFDNFLKDKISSTREDFAYLSYKDKSKSLLAAYEGMDNPFPSLAFQGFIQYLWNFIPQPPVWIRNGFGYFFWDLKWNQETQSLENSGNLAFLDAARKLYAKGTPDLKTLLTMEDKRDGSAANGDLDYQAWSLVYFLIQSDNPIYNRLLGNLMSNLSPAATLPENTQNVLNKITGVRSLETIQGDLTVFLGSVKGFNDLMNEGIGLYRDFLKAKAEKNDLSKDLLVQASGLFEAAAAINPKDFRPLYYRGLLAYGDGSYTQAESRFKESSALVVGSPGLLPYAQGLTAFYLKKFSEASLYLNQAKLENPTEFSSVVDTVLEMML